MKIWITTTITLIALLFKPLNHNKESQKQSNYNDWAPDTNLINKHFQGKTANLFKSLGHELRYPRQARDLYSQAIVLFECRLFPDTTRLVFIQDYGLNYEKTIVESFNKIQSEWKNVPNEGISFLFSIGFELSSYSNGFETWKNDSVFFKICSYELSSGISDETYCQGCLFCNNNEIKRKLKLYQEQNNSDSAQLFVNELKRRDPLNKFNLMN